MAAFRSAAAIDTSGLICIDEANGKAIVDLPKAQVRYSASGNESLSLVKLTPEQKTLVENFPHTEIIGEWINKADEKFSFIDAAAEAKYDAVYPRGPFARTDPETGEEETYTLPEKFCVLARDD